MKKSIAEIDVILMERCPEADRKGTGIRSYSKLIKSIIRSKNIHSANVYFKLRINEGYLKCLIHGYILPSVKLRKLNGRLYHATDELCCLSYPFFKGKKVVTFHHVFKESEKEGQSPLLFKVWGIAAKWALKYSDAIIAVSNQTKNELVEILGADPDKVYVLEHSINPFYMNLGIPREKMIGFVGTLIERKNVSAGIRAFKLFTEMPGTEEYKFVICGSGVMKKELVSLSESLSIADRVEFISDLTTEELRDFYNRMAVFANSSTHEGLGLTAVEAQACGVPIVYFKDAEIPEEITKNFISSVDEEDFARNMYRLVTDEEFRASSVSKDVFGMGNEEYAEELFKIYFKVVGKDFLE